MSYPVETDEHGNAMPTVSPPRKQPVTLFKEVWVWSKREEQLYRRLCRGFTLHLCSGKSFLGDVRCDLALPSDLKADMYHLPFRSFTFDTVITDPPWHLKHVYLLKKISPQIKLIYVWERPGIL